MPTHTSAPPPAVPGITPPAASTPTLTSTPHISADELARRLPRWRGFNLLEKFTLSGNAPYQEWDFDFISRWGFDFVRLPADYRIWTVEPGQYLEKPLQEIDQAVQWGQARGIHVNLCLHRAPGYCVNPPAEALDLWGIGSQGDQARLQFAEQWRMFAARYKGIPPTGLSFDLVNEPGDIDASRYVPAIALAVEAIRSADPDRLIVADGLAWGRKPVPELIPLGIAQSTRGYDPMQISHYRADWIAGSQDWPQPRWPQLRSPNLYLYGKDKPEFRTPLRLEGDFSTARQISLQVGQVSHRANLIIRADDKVIFEKWYEPGEGKGEWKASIFHPELNSYQAIYDKWVTADLPAGTQAIQIEVTQGDWITIPALRLSPFAGAASGALEIQPGSSEWGVRQEALTVDAQGSLSSKAVYDRQSLWNDLVEPWVKLAARGVGVHVGEWGAYAYTPHAVTLAWMTDCLENWKKAGFGWALWNLRGSFGILDSGRADVGYEDYQGHRLDRRMLDLLLQG